MLVFGVRHVLGHREKFEHLKTLEVFGVNLVVTGVGAECVDDGALEIASNSLSSLEMRELKAATVTLRHALSLE
jgi:hypothetical protein